MPSVNFGVCLIAFAMYLLNGVLFSIFIFSLSGNSSKAATTNVSFHFSSNVIIKMFSEINF